MGKVKVEKDVSWQNINEKLNFWKLKMKLQEEMFSFELWMYSKYQFSKWNYLIRWMKDLDTLADWLVLVSLLEDVWVSDLQVYQQVAAGTVDVAAVTLKIQSAVAASKVWLLLSSGRF